MPSDDYSSIARGPLRLKGAAGVTKKKKKKDKSKKDSSTTDLAKSLSTGDDEARQREARSMERSTDDTGLGDDEDGGAKLWEEREDGEGIDAAEQDNEEDEEAKTETERRFAEAKRKRLKELTESGRIRPELLKTHKQRVEELNAHLARLSEHHDMPKIGPG
ncbi:hypothetical protein B0J18DRAFT_153929 [Chaetomium sp. MPI-SDFR-AT-0129]|nr:hypothetical protein B0J18DRAFT_153929 [Chaetomium sp. MPI-SDFR-AT-0129]